MGFFKAYDMRGTFGTDFDLSTVYKIGRELPDVLRSCNGDDASSHPLRILVGRDCRQTSASIRTALVKGLRDAGAEVTDLGLATTPMVYFFTAAEGFDGSVMITASHNPPSDNGLKVSRRGALPVGYESGLAEVERRVSGSTMHYCVKKDGLQDSAEPQTDALRLAQYVKWLKEHAGFDVDELRAVKFAVDCSDGMASILAHELFPNAVFINDVPDGTFPHHAPNPLLAESRTQIANIVRKQGLDCGVIFDGDADRCMFVDETGAFIQPDYLIPVLAQTFAEQSPVIYDVRTSRAAIDAIREIGCEPVIGKVGHAYAKVLLRQVKGVCGGEFAGHYYFRDFYGCDSGELAAVRILGAFLHARENGKTVSRFMFPITGKYANSGEINFKVDDKPSAITRVLAAAKDFGIETKRCEIDGVRLEFPEGWISVRQSNTEPYLRLLIECDTPERLAFWRERLTEVVQSAEN